jgi:hypothetical protein
MFFLGDTFSKPSYSGTQCPEQVVAGGGELESPTNGLKVEALTA